jgi:riboflavin kinase/FMN adenylyltransferase
VNETHRVDQGTAVTIGFFDGFHRGHQELVRRTVAWAAARSGRSVALTFDVNPREVLLKTGPWRYLTPLPQKVALLQAAGLDEVVILPFTPDLAALPGDEFVRQVLQERLAARHVVVGADFAFGRNRAWDAAALREFGLQHGFTVEVVPEIRGPNGPIRSTSIRQLLESGQVQAAAYLLGRPFSLTGKVVPGRQLGSSLGFPTANLQPDERQFYPPEGVFAVAVEVGPQIHRGVLNIGMKPTVAGTSRTLEVHLLDFSGDLYGRELTVFFLERLRSERKFPSLEELRAAIAHDVERVRALPLQFPENMLQ